MKFVWVKKRSYTLFWGLFIFLILLRVWSILGVPKYYIYAPQDDLYYAKAAHFIIHGQWMGPYDYNTLIKAPFYAFFMIFSYFTGLPLLLNETLFYIISCLILYISLSPLIPNKWWRLFLFSVMLFLPACSITHWTLRVYREFVYFSLTLLIVAFSLGLFLRLNDRVSSTLKWAIGLGISLGAFMITREEGVWIYPAMFIILVYCLAQIWRQKLNKRWLRSSIVLLPILLSIIPIFVVSALNFSNYGFWGVSENAGKDLNRVLNTLFRIKYSEWKPYKPMNTEILSKAYSVSPLFTELKPYIGTMESWIPYSDVALSAKPNWYLEKYFVKGKEIAGGHFSWLFRSALGASGKYSNGTYPREYLVQLADQLEEGCSSGALNCSKSMNIPLIGSIRLEQIPITMRFFFGYFQQLLLFDGTLANPVSLDLADWHANRSEFKFFDEFVYNPIGNEYFGNKTQFDQIINGKVDLRLKTLDVKYKLVKTIFTVYKFLLLPTTILLVFGFVSLGIFNSVKKRRNFNNKEVISLLLVSGFLFSRLGTLAIVDATTSVPAIHYITSCYVYLYILLFLLMKIIWHNLMSQTQNGYSKLY